ncbi:unnamed protein product [Urochloa humidicola]
MYYGDKNHKACWRQSYIKTNNLMGCRRCIAAKVFYDICMYRNDIN